MQTTRGLMVAVFALAAMASAACGRRTVETSAGDVVPDSATYLIVDNRAFPDMTIYLLEGGSARQRLGTAWGLKSTRIPISRTIVGAGRELQFVADPIGARGNSVSQRIFVRRGDQVVMTIMP